MKKQYFKIIYLFVIALLITTSVSAQTDVLIRRGDFKLEQEGFREAWKNVRLGNREFEKGKDHYQTALEFFVQAAKYNPDNAALNYKIGACYLYSSTRLNAIKFLEKAYEANDSIATDLNYLLGKAFQLTYQFDKAIKSYYQFKKDMEREYNSFHFVSKKTTLQYEYKYTIIDKLIDECTSAKLLVTTPQRIIIENLGTNVNSIYPDYSPFLLTSQNKLLFTTRRSTVTGQKINVYDNRFFEDVFVTNYNNQSWMQALSFGKPFNEKPNDAIIGLTSNEQTLYIYRGAKRAGDIFESTFKDGNWTKPKRLSKNINTRKGKESSISVTADGKELYFVSNKEGATGGFDIYMCKLDEKGKWGEPQNLGINVNTIYDEVNVFVFPDGKTLYFSSNGHNTMGGYDIFKSVRDANGNWSKAENMGYPINSPDNDRNFFTFDNQTIAYFASVREGGLGFEDIYEIQFLGEEKPSYQSNEDDLLTVANVAPFKPQIFGVIEGLHVVAQVIDFDTKLPIQANVVIKNTVSNEVILSTTTNSLGNFTLELTEGGKFEIRANAPGYFYKTETTEIVKTDSYQEINLGKIELMKIVEGAKLILKNVFFDTGKSTLRPESFSELDNLISIMKENPTLRFEISGHTDNTGAYQNNVKLSEDRANAVVKYLVSKGIDATRLTAKGYADKEPIATNETEEGRQLNRRVEAKIVN